LFWYFSFQDIFAPEPYNKFELNKWKEIVKDLDVCSEYPSAVIDDDYVRSLGDRFEASVIGGWAEILRT